MAAPSDPLELAVLAARNAAILRVSATATASIATSVYSAYGGYGTAASKGLLQAIAAVGTPESRAAQKAMYERLGELTVRATVDAYDRSVGANGHATGYRRGTGSNARLTGKLRPPIAGNVNGTIYKVVSAPQVNGGVRIELFNMKHLSQVAKHWARINFGAGVEGAGDPADSFTLRMAGTAEVLSFNSRARPAYRIPKGYWYAGGENVAPSRPTPGEAFFLRPKGKATFQQQAKFSRGFGGRNFLDAGLGAFARALPDEFNDFLVEMLSRQSRLRLRFDVQASSRRL